jgi:hypothetical protein
VSCFGSESIFEMPMMRVVVFAWLLHSFAAAATTLEQTTIVMLGSTVSEFERNRSQLEEVDLNP